VDGEVRTSREARAAVTMRGAGELRAAWPDGIVAVLRARRDGAAAWRVDCSVSTRHAVRIGAVGVHVDELPATRVLVDGYHSWDWAGVRDATAAGRGWWGCVWGTPRGAATSVALVAPPKLGPLLLRWSGGAALAAFSVGAPPQLRHATGPPPLLGVPLAAGATLHGDPVRVSALERRSPWGLGLPRPGPRDRRPPPRVAGWMSWNCLGPSASAADVVAAARTLVPPGGVALLDDGWMPLWGDWRERSDFDSALGDLAGAVHATGRRLGVWLAPFLVDPQSRTAAERAHLLLRDARSGDPVQQVRAPRPQHVIDASLPAARAHLATLGRRMGRLGVDALKLDFLFAGALPGARTGMSDVAALRAGVAALVRAYRSTAPRGSRVFACGAPAAPLVGLVDACRSGDDSVLNVPPANVPLPPRPWYLHGDATLRAQSRNLAARSWLWGATVPPDVDAVSLAQVGDTAAPAESYAREWLQLAVDSGGPLLDADAPDGRVAGARLRMLRRAQGAVMRQSARPRRPHDPLSGSALADDDAGFHDFPGELPR